MKFSGIRINSAGFADQVKKVSYDIFAWAGLQPGPYYEEAQNYPLKNVILPKINKTPRQIWVGVGNGVRQAVGHDDTWLDYLINNVNTDVLIISDLRFPAEANGLLKYGGFIYKIDRDSEPKVTDGADDPMEDYTNWTGVIKNNGTLKDLHKQVSSLVDKHFINRLVS